MLHYEQNQSFATKNPIVSWTKEKSTQSSSLFTVVGKWSFVFRQIYSLMSFFQVGLIESLKHPKVRDSFQLSKRIEKTPKSYWSYGTRASHYKARLTWLLLTAEAAGKRSRVVRLGVILLDEEYALCRRGRRPQFQGLQTSPPNFTIPSSRQTQTLPQQQVAQSSEEDCFVRLHSSKQELGVDSTMLLLTKLKKAAAV